MTYRIIKRPAAERDIEECFVHIAESNLDKGIAFLVAIENSLERLAEFPLVGKPKEFSKKTLADVRVWPVKGFANYLIFYLVNEESVELIRLLHGARDFEALFG